MVHSVNPDNRITIHFECFDDNNIHPDSRYVAWIEGDDYKGMSVSGESIGDCVKELGISLQALELYRKNLKNPNLSNNNINEQAQDKAFFQKITVTNLTSELPDVYKPKTDK